MTDRVRQTVLSALMSRHEDADDHDGLEHTITAAGLARQTGLSSPAVAGALQTLRRDGRAEYLSWCERWAFVPTAKEVPHA